MSELKTVWMYTDGAAQPNPGKGGYGCILIHGRHTKELSKAYLKTTNNRMELMGVIAGFEALKYPCEVSLFSDSKYVVNGMSRYILSGKDHVNPSKKNADLWNLLLKSMAQHVVHPKWIRGHSGDLFNEKCDKLATSVIKNGEFIRDKGYDQNAR